jgi:hypothetical protein
MQNSIVSLNIQDLLNLGSKTAAGATAIGQDIGLVINVAGRLTADQKAAADAVLAYQTAVADRVPKANLLATRIGEARTWCFRAKDTLKPHLGETHNSLYRATGFTMSLRVPDDYAGLYSLVGTLCKYFTEHAEQTNDKDKVKVTPERATQVQSALKAAQDGLDAQEDVIADRHSAQETALESLRNRLRGLRSELEQLLGLEDRRWRRFGLNIPAEPETPAQPEAVTVSSPEPGKLLLSCAPVPFAERYRWFAQRVGTSVEIASSGSSIEPLFVVEGLVAGARYNVCVSAVNVAGNEGSKSPVVVAETQAQAAVA